MSDFQKALDHLSSEIQKYRKCDIMDGESLVKIMQQITATLFYLENIRSEYHDKFQNKINELVLSGSTVSRSENEAHTQIPEMYLLRHIMTSAYNVSDAIRTNISYLKTERFNAEKQTH